MSDNTDGLGDEDGVNTDNETKKPNGLRQALEAAKAERDQFAVELDELRKERRQRTVAESLEKHGASPRLAKFYDKADASEDDVLGWLRENGEDFGWSDSDAADTDDAETMEEARRISRATASAPQKAAARTLTRDLLATGDYKELRKQGLVL